MLSLRLAVVVVMEVVDLRLRVSVIQGGGARHVLSVPALGATRG